MKKVKYIMLGIMSMTFLTSCNNFKIIPKSSVEAKVDKSEYFMDNKLDLTMSARNKSTIDDDGDGLPDKMEKEIGSNAKNMDTDGDSISDYMEYVVYKTDPNRFDEFEESPFNFMSYGTSDGVKINYVGKGEKFPDIKYSKEGLESKRGVLTYVFTIKGIDEKDYTSLNLNLNPLKHLESDIFFPGLYKVSESGKINKAKVQENYNKGLYTADLTESGTYVVLNTKDHEIDYTIQDIGMFPTVKIRGLAVNFDPANYVTIHDKHSVLYTKEKLGTEYNIISRGDKNYKYWQEGTIEYEIGDTLPGRLEVISIDRLGSSDFNIVPGKSKIDNKLVVPYNGEHENIGLLKTE